MIEYKKDIQLNIEDVIRVFNASTIVRPTGNFSRIKKMFDSADIVISAWHKEKLIGVCRALTDFSYCCYLSDLAVDAQYQNQGIGKAMIEITKEAIGDEVALILLAAPNAMDYYPKIGFEKLENGFIIKRKQ
jgi:N-acetylglutamate synthase-like GNAT family acetyltransferase